MAGPGICVLCLADTCISEVHPVFNPVAPYGYLLSDMYFFGRYHKSRLVCIGLDITRFCEQQRQPYSGFAWPACPKTVNWAPIAGGGRGRHNLHGVCQTAVTASPRVGCVAWYLSGLLLHLVIKPLSSIVLNTVFPFR